MCHINQPVQPVSAAFPVVKGFSFADWLCISAHFFHPFGYCDGALKLSCILCSASSISCAWGFSNETELPLALVRFCSCISLCETDHSPFLCLFSSPLATSVTINTSRDSLPCSGLGPNHVPFIVSFPSGQLLTYFQPSALMPFNLVPLQVFPDLISGF